MILIKIIQVFVHTERIWSLIFFVNPMKVQESDASCTININANHYWQPFRLIISLASLKVESLFLDMTFQFHCSHWLENWGRCFVCRQEELHRVHALSSSPLPYAMFAPTLFEFDPIKLSLPLDWVISRWADLWQRH